MALDQLPPTDEMLFNLACRVGDQLRRLGWKLVTAESCTGGWIAKLITDRPGSSAWYDRGFVTYSNGAKRSLLGVPEATLLSDGAVSQAAVTAMAEGALRHSEAEIVVAVTGIAGPDGGTPEKPVGTVWLGWATRAGSIDTERCQFSGSREAVRRATCAQALSGLLERLTNEK